jgi:transmembrane sensor
MILRENSNILMDDYIVAYLSGQLDKDKVHLLREWISFSDENQSYFNSMREVWLSAATRENTEKFSSDYGLRQFKRRVREQKEHASNIRSVSMQVSKIAAAIVVLVFLSVFVSRWHSKTHVLASSEAYSEIIVPLGAKSQVVLPDGSVVWINAGSRLKYSCAFGEKKRELFLEGEGYFTVAKNPEKPFIVKTHYIDVQAVGTEFNVKAYPNEKTIETVLIKGSVRVNSQRLVHSAKSDAGSIYLKPNQKLTYIKETEQFMIQVKQEEIKKQKHRVVTASRDSVLTPIQYIQTDKDPVIDASWKDKRWLISGEELGSLANKLERRYDISIVFDNKELTHFKFNGIIEDESIEQVLKAMSYSSPIRFSIKGKKIKLSTNESFVSKYNSLYKR